MTQPEAIDLAALRAQASDPDFSRTSGIMVPAFTVLALLDRLAAASEVVEAARRAIRPQLEDDAEDLAWRVADAVSAYDRAIAGQRQRQEGT